MDLDQENKHAQWMIVNEMKLRLDAHMMNDISKFRVQLSREDANESLKQDAHTKIKGAANQGQLG